MSEQLREQADEWAIRYFTAAINDDKAAMDIVIKELANVHVSHIGYYIHAVTFIAMQGFSIATLALNKMLVRNQTVAETWTEYLLQRESKNG